MTEIYLIRHTQAEGNRWRIIQGQWDGGVTALGEQELACLSARFRSCPLDAVWSSDLYRARHTAEAISVPAGLPLHTDPRLREVDMGPWEAKFFGNLRREDPVRAHAFIHDPDHFILEGAETYAQAGDRMLAALTEIAGRYPGGRVAVVSHGAAIRSLMSRITGVPLSDVETLPFCPNTGVTRLGWDGERFTAGTYGDARHLEGLRIPSWARGGDVRHEPLDPAADGGFYLRCYEDAWLGAHGSLEGFSAPVYLHAALEHRRADPENVLRMLVGDETVGLLDLDMRRGAHAGYGWISLLYLLPEHRRRGFGIQVLARAFRKCGELGLNSVRLNVAAENLGARAFYEKEGFVRIGGSGDLLLLEKKLWRPEP